MLSSFAVSSSSCLFNSCFSRLLSSPWFKVSFSIWLPVVSIRFSTLCFSRSSGFWSLSFLILLECSLDRWKEEVSEFFSSWSASPIHSLVSPLPLSYLLSSLSKTVILESSELFKLVDKCSFEVSVDHSSNICLRSWRGLNWEDAFDLFASGISLIR